MPARGVERWLSQRLSHRLGHGEGRDDGVCAGVQFRSPASLVAELVIGRRARGTTTRGRPTRSSGRCSRSSTPTPGEAWCRALSLHLGHGQTGEEGELRRGRRYAVARRLARLFASYAVQRPTLLADWEAHRDTDGAGGELAPDLAWQPELWRLLVRRGRRSDAGAAAPHASSTTCATEPGADRPARPASRCSGTPGSRSPRSSCWPPSASTATSTSGCRTPPTRSGRRSPTSRAASPAPTTSPTSGSGTRCSPRSGRDLRELERTLGSASTVGRRSTSVSTRSTGGAVRPATLLLLAPGRHRRQPASVDPAGRAIDADDRSVQVHACHGPARQVEVLREVLLGLLADDPDPRAARHPGDVPRHRGLRAADLGGVRDGRDRRPPRPPAPGAARRPLA